MITGAERKEIEERMQAIADANGGKLTPSAVVDDARNPSSPLHGQFEWDDSKAAEAYRVVQARTLIRSVECVIRTTTVVLKAPFYIRDPDAGSKEQGYVTVTKLRTDEDAAREAAVNELIRANQYLLRAKTIVKALGLDAEFDQLMAGTNDLRRRLDDGGGSQAHPS